MTGTVARFPKRQALTGGLTPTQAARSMRRDVVVLPWANDAKPPDPPPGFTLAGTAATLWAECWATGASTRWLDDDLVAVAVYVLAAARYADEPTERTAALATELRRSRRELGLSPEGRALLRWVSPDDSR